MARFCAECGSKIEDNERFCGECGTPVADEKKPDPEQNQNNRKEENEQHQQQWQRTQQQQQQKWQQQGPQVIIAQSPKSLGLGLMLTALFGGLGMFYSSITGGIIMSIVEGITFLIAVCTFGFGLILFIPVHIVAMVWTAIAINKYNQNLYAGRN